MKTRVLLIAGAAAAMLLLAAPGRTVRIFIAGEPGAPAGAQAAAYQAIPAPSMRFQPNESQATTAPWIESNGWRFARGIQAANYSKLPPGSAVLAAAEAFTYGVDAILNPDPADRAELGRMLDFLKSIDQPVLPPMANIAIVDERSPAMDELLNLLTRRNLLYRIVSAPDRKADLTVQLGSKDFPRDSAANPSDFAARVREKLGDDRRLVRLYGSNTTIARLAGDATHARLFLLTYGRGRGGGGGAGLPMRVRVLGAYMPSRFAGYGVSADARLADIENPGNNTTEFSVPAFNTLAVVDLDAATTVIESSHATRDFELNPDPKAAEWAGATPVRASHDYYGRPLGVPAMEIRSRWTRDNLYLLYSCPYDTLNLKPDPKTTEETPRLWNWDVAEAFIGSDYDHIGRYKEFQVSPQGEWVDLDIDRDNQRGQAGMTWNSGYTVKARIDAQAKIWYGAMRIPFKAIDTRPAQPGRELRIGLYRIAGLDPNKLHYAWRPTNSTSFHVPQAFGTLRLR